MRTGARSSVIDAVPLALCVLAAGCGFTTSSPPADTTIQPIAPPPVGGIDGGAAVVPMGIVVGFALTSNSSRSESNTVSVDDPAVVTLFKTTDPSTFTLVGKGVGQTTLRATAAGATETTMSVMVTEQNSQP
jgi:hypothetical protein